MAVGVVVCGCASLPGALVTLSLVRKNAARARFGAQVRTATVQAPAHAGPTAPRGAPERRHAAEEAGERPGLFRVPSQMSSEGNDP
ncbi:hypothetical protein QF030_001373 [Streptomyces rishiriensis]|uniref:Uncharacterized protein n=1 Tax=Streptomyces rishiriensis TaxID=68264 RepID=A0ABU0NJD6_STRRH|nr:hypothetical protein [Streptomyces rishiriensis]